MTAIEAQASTALATSGAFGAAGEGDGAAPGGVVLEKVTPPSRERDVATNEPWVVEFRRGDVIARPLGEVRSVTMTAEDFAAGDDVIVAFDLFVKGVTDQPKDDKAEGRMKRELRKLAFRVESDLIKNGSVTLHDAGASGEDDVDAAAFTLLYWSLSSPENKTGRRSESGTYPLKFFYGKKSLGSLKLRWENER